MAPDTQIRERSGTRSHGSTTFLALNQHLAQTANQVTRLEEAFEYLDTTPRTKACEGMRGIIDEGETHVKEDFADDSLRDAVIVGSAQRAEHYEIAAYGTAAAHARQLSLNAVANLLDETLEEEKTADLNLTDIAESMINIDAAT